MRYTLNCPIMVIKGRSRSNGAQLADYLQRSKGNDRVTVLDVRGTTRPEDLRRSLVEMSMSSELTKRGKLGLYHSQVNPAYGEDRPMTPADWLRAADILEEHLGLSGQKRAIVLHEKAGRIHGHVVWERYDHETGRFRSDGKNYDKHDAARAQIEQEFNHERTPQKAQREPTDRETLTQLWQQHEDAAHFVQAAQEAGYIIAQGNDRRPFRVITPGGQSLNLVRQLADIDTKEVRARLHPIRADLPSEAEAVQRYAHQADKAITVEQPEPQPAEPFRDLSDSQDRAAAMLQHVRDQSGPPAPSQAPAQPTPPDQSRDLSEAQDAAAMLLECYRQRQAEREAQQRKLREMQQQAAEQTRQREQPPSLTDQAAELLERYRQRQRDRGHDRDGLDFE